MNRAWGAVLLGGLSETVWAATMKMSDGFTDPLYTLATIGFLVVSTLLLNVGLRSGLPVGPCYAVWVGTGSVGAVIVGMLVFGEVLNVLGFVFLAVIICGILGLNLVSEEE